MKTTPVALVLLVIVSAANQNAFAQQKPATTSPATVATHARPELTPGPRPLTKREEEALRAIRLEFAAQAKNDYKTLLQYTADEYFIFDRDTDELATKESLRNKYAEMPANQESNIKGAIPDAAVPALRRNQMLVLAGDTAVYSELGRFQRGDRGTNWVPLRVTTVWTNREGRWQVLTGFSNLVKKDGTAK